jgi:hypothetical protein
MGEKRGCVRCTCELGDASICPSCGHDSTNEARRECTLCGWTFIWYRSITPQFVRCNQCIVPKWDPVLRTEVIDVEATLALK